MLRKLGIGLLIVVLLLGVVGLGAYSWVRSELWSRIDLMAQEQGAFLEKPALEIRWLGDWRFFVRMKGLKGELRAPMPVTGKFQLPLFEVDAELNDERTRVHVENLLLQSLTGEFEMRPGPTESDEATAESADIEIPKLEVPSLDRPELPIQIEARAFTITTERIVFRRVGDDSHLTADLSKMSLKGRAQLESSLTEFDVVLEVAPAKLSQKTATQDAVMNLSTVNLSVKSNSTPEKPLQIAPVAEGRITWDSIQFNKSSPAGESLVITDQGGELMINAAGSQLSVSAKGRKLAAPQLKKTSDWSLEFTPLKQSSNERTYQLNAKIPGLLDLNSTVNVPAVVSTTQPKGQWKGKISAHSDLSLLVLDENPVPWKTQLSGPFDVRLSSSGELFLKTELSGEGFAFNLESELNPTTQEAQASGFVSMNFRDRGFSFSGIRPQGQVSAPFKFLIRQQKKFFFESELRFRAFSLFAKDFQVESMIGSIPVKQAWSFEKSGWQLSPRLLPNAFGRADFDSFQPLESRQNQLRIAVVKFHEKTYGPVVMDLKFDQNLLRSGSWSARVGEGEVDGALQADVSLDNPRMGLLMRAFNVKLEDLLPETMFRSQQKSENGLAFRLGMDWDLGKATAVGRLDWSEINATQVMQILDLLDPQFENATFNQARMILAQAYPTRVQVEMRGPVADIRISTNVMNLPEVRNVAISPYLVKANESLYSSELYQTLRSTSTPQTKPAVRKEP